MEECAVLDPGNGVELVIEVGEGAALAGDVDQVRYASVQQKAPGTGHLQHIRKKRWLLDVRAACAAAVGFELERHATPELPLGGVGGAADGDLPGLGRAVDLQQLRVEASLGLGGELLRER